LGFTLNDAITARTSSFAFKDTDKTIAEIADILGVQAVLEGSVRRSGDRVRVSAQLIDASNGFHIWSRSYERQLNDIFQLQDEMARAVVKVLRIELGVNATTTLVSEHTLIPEAYNWFIRGRALYDWANPGMLYKTASYFEKAVEADPDYALAWGHLAFTRMTSLIFRPFDEVAASVIAAYERALALDPDQSEALSAKALDTICWLRSINELNCIAVFTAASSYYQRLPSLETAYDHLVKKHQSI